MFTVRIATLCAIICDFTLAYQTSSSRSNADRNTTFHPLGLALGSSPSANVSKFKSFKLSPEKPYATIDYGSEVGGYPLFGVDSVTGKVQIEVKYSEPFPGLNELMSDGPLPYAAGLSNNFRVETFEIVSKGLVESFLIQGGLRWQSIRLLTNGTVKFSSVNLRASFPGTDLNALPGSFACDNELLNQVWELGAKAADAWCVEAGTQEAVWKVSEMNGAFVRNMRPVSTYKSAEFINYNLEFQAKIKRGGTGWVMAYGLTSGAGGIQLNLMGELPSNSTFVNTNTSLTPPNSIMLGYGYSFVNQTTLESYYLDTFPISFSNHKNMWYTINSALSTSGYLSVSINNTKIFNVSLANYYIGGSSIPVSGSFGFGAWQDQSAYFKNALAFDTTTNTLLYNNTLTSASVLSEYGVNVNSLSLCLDGPKRDRLVWLGDFIHTGRIVATSTSRFDIIKSTLQLFLDWQSPLGLLPFAPPMGYDPAQAGNTYALAAGVVEVYGLVLTDYQILGLISFCDYVKSSNDLTFAAETWSKWEFQTAWLMNQINTTTGLLALPGVTFLDSSRSQGSAASCGMLEALHKLTDVAIAINQTASASKYRNASVSLFQGINTQLWNEQGGFYSLSPAYPNDFSVAGIALCLSSGAANATQAARSVAALEKLRLSPGFKDTTLANSSDPSVVISPNTNGFLLSSLLAQNTTTATAIAKSLLETLWGAMLASNETSTGASWEYADQNGQPGLGMYTSLSHPWGGAPTYLLSEYVAGLRQKKGVRGFGWTEWIVAPGLGLEMGLERAETRVVTPFGELGVGWKICEGKLNVTINAPRQTEGLFILAGVEKRLTGGQVYEFQVTL